MAVAVVTLGVGDFLINMYKLQTHPPAPRSVHQLLPLNTSLVFHSSVHAMLMYRKIGGIIIYRRREYRCCSARVRSTWRAHSTWPLLFWRGRYYLSRALKLLPQMPINSEVDIILSS